MSQPFDIRQFPGLPPEVVRAFEAQQFELAVERAARQHAQAVGAEKDVFITELKALVEKLESQVADHRRTKFGPKSEKLSPDQLELALEDQEIAIAETQQKIEAVQNKIDQLDKTAKDKKPRKQRKPRTLPEGLPRVERVINPENIVCPCGCGDMVKIGEDRSEWLDVIPAQYKVIVTVRQNTPVPRDALAWCRPRHLRIYWKTAGRPKPCWRRSLWPNFATSIL
jgi:transposase